MIAFENFFIFLHTNHFWLFASLILEYEIQQPEAQFIIYLDDEQIQKVKETFSGTDILIR